MAALAKTSPVGIVGAGTMGAGIAQVAATAGHPVLLFDVRPGAAVSAREVLLGRLAGPVAKGRLAKAQADAIVGRIEPVSDLAALAPAGLVVEAIVEELAAKRELFRALEARVAPDAILASNTSSLSITAIAAGLARPEWVAGMHFFNPPPVLPLVEIVAGLTTAQEVAATLVDTAAAWGKTPVLARNTPGFIVNRVARPFYGEALRLLAEGAADVATLDAIYREAGGFRMGPFELTDLIGQDINAAVTRSVFTTFDYDRRFQPSPVQDELVEAGWLGRKSGRGFYRYDQGAERPQAATVAAGSAPASIIVEGDLGPAEALLPLISVAGIQVSRRAGEGLLRLGEVVLALTDGRCASERGGKVALFDLALDYATASRVAVTANHPEALAAAAGLFGALGKAVSPVADVPGLVIMRTMAMLANEAADAVQQQVATADAVDTAMRLGVAYPLGPLAWAERIGWQRVVAVIERLAAAYGGDRYRPCLWLKRRIWES
ncbi:MAG: 3-hydroxyacyl-CoA dehydrogenase [Geminicoccaceae bacterium]